MLRRTSPLLASLIAAVAWGETLVAQTGSCQAGVRVISATDSTPIPMAEVAAGAALVRSDSAGFARLAGLSSEAASITVRRIGFQPLRAVLRNGCEDVSSSIVTLALRPRPQTLSAVTVRGDERQRFTGPMAGFWERRLRGEGTYFTALDIDNRNVQRLSDLLRTVPGWGRTQQADRFSEALTRGTAVRMGAAPREQMRTAATRCFPTVVVDGMAATQSELNVDGLDPRSLSGVEVYVDGARTPSEFWGTAGQGRCGVVAVWSRSLDNLRHTPLELQAALADTVYEAHEVDEVSRHDSTTSLHVIYPKELRRKKQSGDATVSIVVLPTGEPFLRRLQVVHASHPEFGAALLEAVSTLRFVPARRNGTAVAQRAELTVRFQDAPMARP